METKLFSFLLLLSVSMAGATDPEDSPNWTVGFHATNPETKPADPVDECLCSGSLIQSVTIDGTLYRIALTNMFCAGHFTAYSPEGKLEVKAMTNEGNEYVVKGVIMLKDQNIVLVVLKDWILTQSTPSFPTMTHHSQQPNNEDITVLAGKWEHHEQSDMISRRVFLMPSGSPRLSVVSGTSKTWKSKGYRVTLSKKITVSWKDVQFHLASGQPDAQSFMLCNYGMPLYYKHHQDNPILVGVGVNEKSFVNIEHVMEDIVRKINEAQRNPRVVLTHW